MRKLVLSTVIAGALVSSAAFADPGDTITFVIKYSDKVRTFKLPLDSPSQIFVDERIPQKRTASPGCIDPGEDTSTSPTGLLFSAKARKSGGKARGLLDFYAGELVRVDTDQATASCMMVSPVVTKSESENTAFILEKGTPPRSIDFGTDRKTGERTYEIFASWE